jgi:hypothetical protein
MAKREIKLADANSSLVHELKPQTLGFEIEDLIEISNLK